MTKATETNRWPEEPSGPKYQEELNKNIQKFQKALYQFKEANQDQRPHFKLVMDQTLSLIKSDASEIKRSGINKQAIKLEKDYLAYVQSENGDGFSFLEEDLSALQEYNRM